MQSLASHPGNSEPLGVVIPDPADYPDPLAHKLALAAARCYLLPANPRTKHPGSYAGPGWPLFSSRDPDRIRGWHDVGPDAAIVIHTGRSRLAVVDLDLAGEVIPDELAWLRQGLFQSTRALLLDAGRNCVRGHYVFGSDILFVSGPVRLADGTRVGEVRSGNTVIVTQPSAHVHAESKGGGYRWMSWGAAPPLPAEALEGGWLRVHPNPPVWDLDGKPLNAIAAGRARGNGGNGSARTDTDYPSDDDSTDEQIEAWAHEAFNDGSADARCATTTAVMAKWITAVELEDASYPNLSGGHWQLLNLAAEAGHTGWDAACGELDSAYLDVIAQRAKRADWVARDDTRRSRTDALRKIKAAVESAAVIGALYTPAHCDCTRPYNPAPRLGPAYRPAYEPAYRPASQLKWGS